MITWTGKRVPATIRDRRWWLLSLLAWTLAVAVSLSQHLDDLRRQHLEIASEGARDLFKMVVLMRAWNAEQAGVYVPVSEKSPPNPYLVHPRRDLVTLDGQRLTMINPAYMTRQISELARAKGDTELHITSLRPLRPMNAPDPWERDALNAFQRGTKEVISLVGGKPGTTRLRYMAPLRVTPGCLTCHATQGYQVGDIRGGISVTVPFDATGAATEQARRRTWILHLSVYLSVALLGWRLLELLRKRWHDLAENLTALDNARKATEVINLDLARARDAAEAANQAKSQFLGAVSHELRTPLNGILGFAHLLQRGTTPEKCAAHAARIAEQGAHLLALVEEVMEFARLDSGQGPEQQGEMNLPDLLASLAAELRRAAEAKGLRARIDLAPDLPVWVMGNATWLTGCLRRLLDNAVKFTREGEVALSATAAIPGADGVDLHIEVSDTGIGIAPSDQARLFQAFGQVDGSTTRSHDGLGLGLAIGARYAALLGARLGVKSEPGAGSRFSLDWTARIAHPAQNTVSAPQAQAIPDDLDEALEELARMLEDDDMRSSTLLDALLPRLAGTRDADILARLKQRMDCYDYPAALETLRALREPR